MKNTEPSSLPPLDRLIEQAAFLGSFDPMKLVPGAAEGKALEIIRQLSERCVEVPHEDGFHWALTPSIRSDVFKRLARENRLRIVAESAAGSPLLDEFGRMLIDLVVAGKHPSPSSLSSDELDRLRVARSLLGNAVVSMPPQLINNELERRSIDLGLDQLRSSRLIGREQQLERIQAWLYGAHDRFSLMSISGVGGVGKSALLAELVVRLRGHDWSGQPVVWLDFDHPAGDHFDATSMMDEILRQLALHPMFGMGEIGEKRASLNDLRVANGTNRSAANLATTTRALTSLWSSVLEDSGVTDLQLLVICDTVEKILYRGIRGRSGLLHLLRGLSNAGRVQSIRVLCSGRKLPPAAEWRFDDSLLLEPLSPAQAAELFWRTAGLPSTDTITITATALIDKSGGNLRTVKQLARLAAPDRPAIDAAKQSAVPLAPDRQNDFLPKECDIVMEGGVTSGVVNSAFVAGLAERFTLRSIGGTGGGAVAAIAAAAAQFKRNRVRKEGQGEDDGFHILARVPVKLQETIGRNTRLFSLFQPCAALRPHFRVIATAFNFNETNNAKTAVRLWFAMLRNFPIGAVVGAVVPTITDSLLRRDWPSVSFASTANALWFGLCMVMGALAGALVQATWSAKRGLRANRCGICSGRRTDPDNPPALTEWLHGLVQEISGLPEDTPLTFGQLRTSEPPIELALMTTGLSELRAHRLPHSSADLVFRASELAALFPPAIVDWMKARSRHSRHGARTVALLARMNASDEDYYFMPDPDDLPLVVAARMSLSFPVLLQAVPLYRMRALPVHADGLDLLRVWFSDGGLTSNCPVNFFDSILPTRPTFGVTLQPDLEESDPFAARVSLATNNNAGITAAWLPVDGADGRPSPPHFAFAVLRSVFAWRDEALKRTPGYRDRVVQIRHTRREGGLNLNMPRAAIDVMSRSGAEAARQVIERFLNPVEKENGWLNHRWVRMRSTAAVLQETFAPLSEAWHDTRLAPSYEALWMAHGVDALPAYQLSKSNRTAGFALWESIVALPQQVAPAELLEHAPRPRPNLVIAPLVA